MTSLDKHFYINVGKGGTFRPSGSMNYDTTAADIDRMFARFKENGNKQRRFLLYFHGGLVSANSGMETAGRIVGYANKYVSNEQGYCYPICFVWETGLVETLLQNFGTIKDSAFFKKLLVKIIKVAGRQLGIDLDNTLTGSKGVGSMSDEEIRLQLEKEAPFESVSENDGKRSVFLNATPQQLERDAYYETSIRPEVEAELSDEISNDPALIAFAAAEKPAAEAELMDNSLAETQTSGEKGILSFTKLLSVAVKITVAVIKRYMKKRDHGFYPTVIEEIFREVYIADLGAWVWGSMKDKAKKMWQDDNFSGDPENWHAGTYLLKKLKAYQDEVGEELSIDLVGHSAGSIVSCELVDAIVKRGIGLKFRKIFFMAPACRCDLFADTILQNTDLYKQLRIFTMLDEYETKDHLVPVLYPRSLLYFISGVLEEKEFDAYILGLQRHISGRKPYDGEAVLNRINEHLVQEQRMIYSVTDDGSDEGMRSGSKHHGDFDNDKETTLDSIFYLLTKQ